MVGGSQISISMIGKKSAETGNTSPTAAEFKIEKADKVKSVIIRMNDNFVDLDQPVTVLLPSGKKITQKAERTIGGIYRSLSERFDPEAIFSAEITVSLE
jgi:hypothetical protein